MWSFTGSSAVAAETVHSIADLSNQYLLRVGILASQRRPTEAHPYGYGRDRFIWSLISGVGVFCVGAGVSFAHGLQGLHTIGTLGPDAALQSLGLEHLETGIAVMGASALAEGASFMVALGAVQAGARAAGTSFWDHLRGGADTTSTAVLAEDAAALCGLAVAAGALGATALTGDPRWDACGSIVVGGLLGVVAVGLIQKNRQLLLGRAMPRAGMARVLRHLGNDPVVAAVHDAKTEEIGPGVYRFKAEVDFHGEAVVARHLERLDRGGPALYQRMRAATWAEHDRALDAALRAYGRDVVRALAAEVDRIELELQALDPRIVHVDLEADATGRRDGGGGGPGGG